MSFRLRMIFWVPMLAYAGFLLLVGKNLASVGQVVFAVFQGALLGFLLSRYVHNEATSARETIRPVA